MFNLKDTRVQVFFIACIAVVFLFCKLWEGGLASYDDSFYAAQARGMVEANDYLTPHYGGEAIHHNDPFCLWSMAIAFKIFGFSEYAARFYSAFFGFLTILLVYFLGRAIYNNWTGFFASLVLMTTLIWMKFARHAMFDITLSFWTTLTIFLFILSKKTKNKDHAGMYLLLTGVATGLAILTKSILGSFAMIGIFLFLLFSKDFKTLLSPFYIFSVLLALSVPAAWIIPNYMRYGKEFIAVHYGWIIFERGFVHYSDKQDFWSYLTYVKNIWILYWPWVPFAFFGLIMAVVNFFRKKDTYGFLLVLWIFAVVGIMSIGHEREFRYILPVFIPFAILTSSVFTVFILKTEAAKAVTAKYSLIGFGIIALIIVATPVHLNWGRDEDIKEIAPILQQHIPKGTTLLRYKTEDYFTLQQPFMAYTFFTIDKKDIAAKEEIEKILSSDKQSFVITYIESYKELSKKYPIIAMSNQMVVFTNKFYENKLYPRVVFEGPYQPNKR